MQVSLSGRTALITGGSKGLGFATARRFILSGANVAILARTPETLGEARMALAELGEGRVAACACDVADPAALTAAYGQVRAELGPIDILVNNAGESRARPFDQVEPEIWQADIDQKLMAAIRLSRLCWDDMKERRYGRIINVLAIAAKSPRAGSMPTSISRAAGLAFGKALAGDGAPHNILVNSLLVGKFVTDQIRRRTATEEERLKTIAETGRTVPLGRMGDPEEFANVACFLASPQASYITGTAINVDGGLSPAS